ncbi:transcription factor DUO1-like [Malania oleifera]|uniref:transcription factor DUO1-like n=1 Tax=Malania oleifera TaxID=397392 RepID=UPI0025AEBF35|nr:transcription factor DUO1-like [Malania oleifera]
MAGDRDRDGGTAAGEIRKGPWKAEEDEVLINHVKKYGPRDWSSIRSKGLLHRTGKSCRLRWVNKLRPNLKHGVKFSMEEERVVIELQAQFGNKWARIATYLPGRTDNDVKNFWSSRQKRLARILQTAPPRPQPTPIITREVPVFHAVPIEAPKFSSSAEQEPSCTKLQPCSSSYEMMKIVPLPELVNMNPNLLNYDTTAVAQLEFNPSMDQSQAQSQILFPDQFPEAPQQDLAFSQESQELMARLEDPCFLDVFGGRDSEELGNEGRLGFFAVPSEGMGCCENGGKKVKEEKLMTPDSFFDDFPTDMFDHIEPLLSPSEW